MAGKPIATLTSMHVCPMCSGYIPHVGGPVTGPGAPNVLINGKPAALLGDMCVCVGPPDTIVQGEPTVLINGTPVATQGSMTAHGGSITVGDPTVLISSATPKVRATMPVKRIPFPKINLFDHLGAAIRGKSADLREAKGNIEEIKMAAVKNKIQVSDIKWRKNGKIIDKAFVSDVVMITAKVNGVNDNQNISLKICEKDEQGEDDQITSVSGIVNNSKLEIEWTVIAFKDEDDTESAKEMQSKGYTIPEFVVKYINSNGETEESNILQLEDSLEIRAFDEETGEAMANINFSIALPDGSLREGQLDDNGYVKLEAISPKTDYPVVFYNEDGIISVNRK